MGRKDKLRKFAEITAFPNVYECFNVQEPALTSTAGVTVDMKGRWKSDHFKNDHPITLELACGGGEYTLELARRFPERNFIGVDVKGNRIWKGARVALAEGLHNAAFLRTRIEVIETFFAPSEIDEIWITFPDPFPQEPKSNRRLTSAQFLGRYRGILKPGGLVHLKHDNDHFFKFSVKTAEREPGCAILYKNEDIYAGEPAFPELPIKTFYEAMHLADGRTIKYLRYTLS